MEIEFDPEKDAANLRNHGISLARAIDLQVIVAVDRSRGSEIRFRSYGLIDGTAYCLVHTVRGQTIRPISLRRAHAKEMKKYAS